MKEFLFSRSHKKHYTNAVVRMGKNNLGFSLVELVIVIAIMAILVAVAIPVLGVFIQKAEKSNDQSVVRDILYAVELANKSGAFADDNSVTFGATKYPIGFVVISDTPDANGNYTKVLTSGTEIVSANTACEFSEQVVTINYLSPKTVKKSCSITAYEKTCYEVKQVSVKYCKTHTQLDTQVDANEYEYASDFSVSCSNSGRHFSCNSPVYSYTMTSVPAGITNFVEDKNQIFTQVDGGDYCSYAIQYVGQDAPEFFSGQNIAITNDHTHPLYQAIAAVYGEGFERTVKLTHDEWTSSGSVPTLYTSANEFFDDVSTLGGYLALASSNKTLKEKFGVSGTYNSSAEVVSGFADTFIAKYGGEAGKTAWESVWNDVPNQGYASCGFGLNGRENYSACRIAYNSSFAAYLRTRGVEEKYVEIVKNYYSLNGGEEFGGLSTIASWLGLNLYDVYLPALITNDAFEEGNVVFNNKGTEITDGGTNLLYTQLCGGHTDEANKTAALVAFNKIWQCYKDYQISDTCEENGRVFYETMITVDDTDDDATKYGDYFGFYSSYLNEMSSLYNTAINLAGENGVIIIVYAENGVATCEVSPSDVDPRNK